MDYPKLSRQALLTAQRIASEVWLKYDDTYGYQTEKTSRNNSYPIDDPDAMFFFWQQFDSQNQGEFEAKVFELPEDDIKTELLDWINTWKDDTLTNFIKNILNKEIEKGGDNNNE